AGERAGARARRSDRGTGGRRHRGGHGRVRRRLRRSGPAGRPRPGLRPGGLLAPAVLGRGRGPQGTPRRRSQGRAGHPARGRPRRRVGRVDLGLRGRERGRAVVRARAGRAAGHGPGDPPARSAHPPLPRPARPGGPPARPVPVRAGRRRHPRAPGRRRPAGTRRLARPPGPPGRYLYEPDGAVIRAHLVAEVARELDGGLVDPAIAYITADAHRPTPYATAYEITDRLPFNVKKLKALLRERRVGTLTVKKR